MCASGTNAATAKLRDSTRINILENNKHVHVENLTKLYSFLDQIPFALIFQIQPFRFVIAPLQHLYVIGQHVRALVFFWVKRQLKEFIIIFGFVSLDYKVQN